eukprot:TRINITY_DN337_c0_g2_i6.p1 TRINITY_DN337_c0_g2~~TRINITY_DN337_c0_g2_i6.p1  ORF type:complete len:705 (-),score=148.61 TRINITY_DN337_c0_g2_i6:34-2148(-)
MTSIVARLSNIPQPAEKDLTTVALAAPKTTTLDPKLLELLSHSPVPKEGSFSTFDSIHVRYASELYDYFRLRLATEDDLPDILDDLAEAKRRLNEQLFQYIFEVFLVHKQQELPKSHAINQIVLPDIIQRMPFLYVKGEQLKSITSPDGKDGTTNEMKFHVTGTEVDSEHKVAWYREDPWWNSHHWHWHVIYPVAGVLDPATGTKKTKDRQGELFYYMHQQMLARYDAERLGAGLAKVVPFKDLRDVMPGYDSHLVGTAGKFSYGPRPKNATMPTIRPFMQYDIIEQETRRQRIFNAIDQGYFQHFVIEKNPVTNVEEPVRKNTKITIDLLGATIEANAAGIEGISNENTFYGSLHNLGHRLIAAAVDPNDSMNWPKGVMGDVATAIRDPMFWRWHRFIDDTINRWIVKQPPHPFVNANKDPNAKVQLPGDEVLTIKAARVQSVGPESVTRNPGHLYTTMENYPMNLLHISPVTDQNYNINAYVKRINYETFNYEIDVENTGPEKEFSVRIWIAPYLKEIGAPGLDRRLFIEMDRFVVTIKTGAETIKRSSEFATILQSPRLDDTQLFDPDHATVIGDETDFCYCGVPRHMLLPRGKKGVNGALYKLFISINDAQYDKIDDAQDRCGSVYCGLKSKKYPVKRDMGYPFDKPLVVPGKPEITEEAVLMEYVLPFNKNMHMSDIALHWVGKEQLNLTRSRPVKKAP